MDTSILENDMSGDVCVCLCVCFGATHRWESDDRSLKAPSGISDMSLPWRDLRKGEREKERGGTEM